MDKLRAVRLDKQGEIDDVAISGDMYRLERLDDNCWWTCVYDGERRTCFHLHSKTPISVECTEDTLGCSDDQP